MVSTKPAIELIGGVEEPRQAGGHGTAKNTRRRRRPRSRSRRSRPGHGPPRPLRRRRRVGVDHPRIDDPESIILESSSPVSSVPGSSEPGRSVLPRARRPDRPSRSIPRCRVTSSPPVICEMRGGAKLGSSGSDVAPPGGAPRSGVPRRRPALPGGQRVRRGHRGRDLSVRRGQRGDRRRSPVRRRPPARHLAGSSPPTVALRSSSTVWFSISRPMATRSDDCARPDDHPLVLDELVAGDHWSSRGESAEA